jgi:hypothetical protein
MDWTFSFWTPGHVPTKGERVCGCASHGFAAHHAWFGLEVADAVDWPTALSGDVLAGSYAEVLGRLRGRPVKPAAVIALFAHATGMEAFLDECHSVLGATPMVGGGAARGAGQTHGELLPAAADVSMLLITQGTWRAETVNVHGATATALESRGSGPRSITHLRRKGLGDWQPAAAAFRALQAEHGRAGADCESISLCDRRGRNVHCSFAVDGLHTDADLPAAGHLMLRTVSRSEASGRLTEFCSVPGALVFGCAGLRGLLDAPIAVAPGALAGFVFGELVTLEGQPRFGNLMAARLVPLEGNPRQVMPHSTHY